MRPQTKITGAVMRARVDEIVYFVTISLGAAIVVMLVVIFLGSL